MYYYPYSEYLKTKYGEKVYKLPVNLPVTCPNRLNGRGCAFCAGPGTGFEAMDASESISSQLTQTRELIERKYHAHKYIAYFQNYTNTFLIPEKFEDYIRQAAMHKDIVEISVSTRPDCLNNKYLEIMQRISDETGVSINIELGLQTVNYHTLRHINRGHTLAEYLDAVMQIKNYPEFTICTHVILNLPGDTLEDVEETAKVLAAMKIDIVKLHSLYIAKNTELCEWFEDGKITLCSKEEYFERVIAFLELLPPYIAVERLFSRVPESEAVFSNWGTSWWKLKDELLKKMAEQQSFQGKRFHYLHGAALELLP